MIAASNSVRIAKRRTLAKAVEMKLSGFGFDAPRSQRDKFRQVARDYIALGLRAERMRARVMARSA